MQIGAVAWARETGAGRMCYNIDNPAGDDEGKTQATKRSRRRTELE